MRHRPVETILTESIENQNAATLLSVALVPKASSGRINDGSSDAIVESFRGQLAQVLLDAEAQELALGGPELVVALQSPAAALTCALEMQQIFEREITGKLGSGQYVLDVGLHHAPGDTEEGWRETTGLRVVTAMREIANGEIAVSGDFRGGVVRGPRVRFHERGDLFVTGEVEPVPVFMVTSGGGTSDLLSQLALPFDSLGQRSGYILTAVLLGIAAMYLYSQDQDWREFSFGNLMTDRPIESIEILHFSGDSISLNSEIQRNSIQNHLDATLGSYEDLRVVRSDSEVHSEKTDVEAILSGDANSAGDWLLVRARVVKASDQSELWSGAYYRRVSEVESISESIATEMGNALGLLAPIGGIKNVKSSQSGPADFATVRSELEDALQQARRLELDDASRITSLNNLADLYYDSGRDDEAIPLYEEVTRLREAAHGVNHPEVAVSLNNLASLYIGKGRYAEAELLYQRSLQIRTRALGARHPRVANAMNNLALLYHRQGRLAEAEELYTGALEIRKLEADMDLSPEAAELANLGARLEIEGNYSAAASTFERALDDETARSGAGHVRTVKLARALGVARGRNGEVDQAESLLQHAISMFTGSVGENHELTARSMSDLGELYRRNGRIEEAQTYHERALAAYENSLGVDHPEVAGTLGYLVAIFEVQGETEKAAEVHERKREIRKTYLGPVFTYVAARSAEQSVIRDRQQDDLTAPRPLHEYQLEVDEGELITEKRRLAENLHNMALLYLDLGRLYEAERHALQALDMRRSIGDGIHPGVALNLHAIGRINASQERYPEAHVRYEEALRIFEVTLGDIHPHVAVAWDDLADLLNKLGLQGQAVYAADRARQTRAALSTDES